MGGRRRRGGEAKKNRKVARFFPRGGSRRSRAAGRGSDAARARSGWLRTLICMVMSSMRAWLLMASELSKRCADSRLLVRLRVNRPTTPFSFFGGRILGVSKWSLVRFSNGRLSLLARTTYGIVVRRLTRYLRYLPLTNS